MLSSVHAVAASRLLKAAIALLFVLFWTVQPAIGANSGKDCQSGKLESTKNIATIPIAIIGEGRFFGASINHLMAYRFDGKAFRAATIQVDERNKNGDLVLEGGLPYTRNSDDGLFDSNDEFIFMSDQLGEDFKEEKIPADVQSKFSSAWKLMVCFEGKYYGSLLVGLATGYVAKDWNYPVAFDSERGVIESDGYRYEFNKDRAALLGQVYLKSQGKAEKVFESSTFTMPMRTPWFVPDLTLDESHFTSTIESWQSGPVRTVVAVGVKMKKFFSVLNLHLFSELVFYSSSFQIPTKVEFIFSPNAFLREGSGVAYAVQIADASLWEIQTNLPPLADGSREGIGTIRAPFVATGRKGTSHFSLRVLVDEKAERNSHAPRAFRRNEMKSADLQKRYPWLKKMDGDWGVFVDFSGLGKGLYDFGLDLILSSGAENQSIRSQDTVAFGWQTVLPAISN
jgi:hypothetical protein